MYDTQVIVTYNDNKGYRNCLRKVTNMNLDKLNIPWEKMDSDLDEETKIFLETILSISCPLFLIKMTINK